IRTYELITITAAGGRFGLAEIAGKVAEASQHDLPYEDVNAADVTGTVAYRRPIEHVRTIYRQDDLSGPLPFGSAGALAIPYESYKLAFTPGLLSLYRRGQETLLPNPTAILRDEGGYILSDDQKAAGLFPASDPDGHWWIPSGKIFYSPVKGDT